MPGVAAQRLAMAESADDDVTLVDCRHAPDVSSSWLYRDLLLSTRAATSTPSSQGMSGRKPQLSREIIVLCDGCNFVDDDVFHDQFPAARVCNEPGRESTRA